MISPDILRRYPFFWFVDDAQQEAMARISSEVTLEKGTLLFHEGQPANTLYVLIDGRVSLCVASDHEHDTAGKRCSVGEVDPGEPFGISSMSYDETYTSCAEVLSTSRAIRIDAAELRKLMTADSTMGYCLLQHMARAALDRLRLAYQQLAAAQTLQQG